MAEVLGKHTRDVDAGNDHAKRMKKADLPRGAEQLPPEKVKRAERARNAALAKVTSLVSVPFPNIPENYFKAAIREGPEVIQVSNFAKNTGERYELQLKRQLDLQRARADNEARLQTIEEAAAKFRFDCQLKHNQVREEIAGLKDRKTSEERRLRGEIERLKLQLSHYALLSGVQISEDRQGAYRFQVRVHQNELVFKVRLGQTDADVEPERASVEQGRLPDFLREPISLELVFLPELLLRSLNTLM